jgi:crossover junction endodeoxyribonuclease RuvC
MKPLNKRSYRVLAIDPGYDRLGIAVLEGDPSRPTLLMSDCVTPPAGERCVRLAAVARALTNAINEYAPDMVGIETLFFSVNKKTALGVAEARGVVLAAAGLAGLPVIECRPQDVKLAVTGHGTADKKAIAAMLPRLIALPPKKRLDDEFDAIAIGITALAHGGIRR